MNTKKGRSPRRLLLLAAVAALTLAAPVAFAGANRWTSGGPFGPMFNSLAIDPRDPDTVYAGTGRAVYRSRDGGLSWSLVYGSTSEGSWYSGLAIDPVSSDVVYASTLLGVVKSTDAGASWFPTPVNDVAVSVAIDPTNPSTVYAGTSRGLHKSTDRGTTWTRTLARDTYSLALSPQNPPTIFGADYESSFYYDVPSTVHKSTDGGTTWSSSVSNLIISPGSLVIDPANPSVMYAGSDGVYKSEDSGATWHATGSLSSGSGPVWDVVLDPRNPNTLYAGTFRGVYRSTDRGVSWSEFGTGLSGREVTALAIDRTGTRLHAATARAGVFDYQVFSGALDLAVGTDNSTTLLLVNPGSTLVREVDNSGNLTPPFAFHLPDLSARAVAEGEDGLTRVLWNGVDGSTQLDFLTTFDYFNGRQYDPIGDWSAADVSAGTGETTVILWTNPDGRMGLWSVDYNGAVLDARAFGPFPGWLARAIAHGTDGRLRVLWTSGDGRIGLSVIDAGQIVSTVRHAPDPGWTARDVTMASDGQARILLVGPGNRMALWSVNGSGAVTAGPVYEPPNVGDYAIRLSAGDDGLTRVLWSGSEGSGVVFLLGLDNVLQTSFDLN